MIDKTIQEKYYVYYLIDPRDHQPFYVGYGQKDRMYNHVREVLNNTSRVNTPKVERIREILNDGEDITHKIIKRFSDRKAAQRYEMNEITRWGREDVGTGILLNLKTGDEKPKRIERKICQYNKFCEFIRTHNSTNAAANELNIKHPSSLANAVRGRIPSYKGYIWCYEGESPKPIHKYVYKWTLDGNLVKKYKNGGDASRSIGCSMGQLNAHIIKINKKEYSTCKGFIFSRNPDFPTGITAERKYKVWEKGHRNKRVEHINTSMVYESVSSAAISTQHNIGDICKCCLGEKPSIAGDQFKYV